jgi:hypothetical protein
MKTQDKINEHIESTRAHIREVTANMRIVLNDIGTRMREHDTSKLNPPELDVYAGVTGKLSQVEYGSGEYKAALEELGPALKHHYEHNRHHPEHFPDGINGMNLLDLIEMLCDWMAAIERMKGGDIKKSLVINAKRFGIDAQLAGVLRRTISYLMDY